MAINVKFKGKNYFNKSKLQEKLILEIKNNKREKRITLNSDKTNNSYWIETKEYRKLLENAITKEYRKDNKGLLEKANEEAAELARYYEVEERVKPYQQSSAYCTIKDHKDNWVAKRPVRLLNPSKTEIRRISKVFLDNINKTIRIKLNLPQWRSTNDAIGWFKNLSDKHERKFVKFDITAFYPSITKRILMNALSWA